MSKPTSKFTFITHAPRTGEIGCLTKQSASLSGRGRRYVQPNQCFKLVFAFVTQPGVTNVVVLEKFGECGRRQLRDGPNKRGSEEVKRPPMARCPSLHVRWRRHAG